jgi:hypoxia up-regulated 1
MNVDGQEFTPEELVAMVLTHAVDISVAYAAEQGGPMNVAPKDIVLTVPSFATQKERLALLDAATLADINVLTLIDETTAAALHYAMDKTFVDGEQLLLFYNMGASSLQVSLIRFFSYEQPQKYGKPKASPALEVLSKAWDITLGGTAFDHLLVE